MTTFEKDIAIIEEAIRANNGFIRQFLAAPRLSSFFIAFGVAGIIVPLAWHFTLIFHGSLSSIPTAITVLLIAVTLVILVGPAHGRYEQSHDLCERSTPRQHGYRS